MVQSNPRAPYISAPDPQVSDLFTPINNTPAIKLFLDWLPINRPGVAPISRGLEIGMAHGYWLVGPFSLLGPLRDEAIGQVVGLLGGSAVILLMTIALSIYGYATDMTDTPIGDSKGWSEFSAGFLIGGIGGAVVAYLLLSNADLILSGFNSALAMGG